MNRNEVNFGCKQVILVRNNEARDNLPSDLQQAICLTVLESKGLEFEEVVIYNFFHDSAASIG